VLDTLDTIAVRGCHGHGHGWFGLGRSISTNLDVVCPSTSVLVKVSSGMQAHCCSTQNWSTHWRIRRRTDNWSTHWRICRRTDNWSTHWHIRRRTDNWSTHWRIRRRTDNWSTQRRIRRRTDNWSTQRRIRRRTDNWSTHWRIRRRTDNWSTQRRIRRRTDNSIGVEIWRGEKICLVGVGSISIHSTGKYGKFIIPFHELWIWNPSYGFP
jgi:hypothetical protein